MKATAVGSRPENGLGTSDRLRQQGGLEDSDCDSSRRQTPMATPDDARSIDSGCAEGTTRMMSPTNGPSSRRLSAPASLQSFLIDSQSLGQVASPGTEASKSTNSLPVGRGVGTGGKGTSSAGTTALPVVPSGASSATSGTTQTGKKKRKKRTKKIANLCFTKYQSVKDVVRELGFFEEYGDEELDRTDFNLVWSDTTLSLQKLCRLQNWQHSNHFPSMHILCRKVHLGLTLSKLKRAFPTHYQFLPRTFSLRSERSQFFKYFSTQGGARKTFILKPNAGCQGKGIILTRDPLSAVEDLENYVVQEYITKPLLIEEKKFDMRVYVLVTSVKHLSFHIYNEGLVRICADNYVKPTDDNLEQLCIHLTNYAVNKHSDKFVFNTDEEDSATGNKRDFAFLNKYLSEHGHDVARLWERIDHLICKSIIAAQPTLAHVYSSVFPHNNDGFSCFEILGFDILVDDKLKPWLMEVNHAPSLACDTPLDRRIKYNLIRDTLNIVNIQMTDRIRHQEKEKIMLARRLQRGGAGGSNSQNNDAGVEGGTPLLQASSTSSFSIGQGLFAEDPQERLAAEDQNSVNYRRLYPTLLPERVELYRELLQAAVEANQAQSTLSQENRQKELAKDREKRRQEGKQDIADKERDRDSASSATTTRTTATERTDRSMRTSSGSNLRSSFGKVVEEAKATAGPRPPPPVNTVSSEKQRLRLQEQMEKHKRRMMLGPRLSVFQLRDTAQMAAAAAMGEYGGQGCPPPGLFSPYMLDPRFQYEQQLQQSQQYSQQEMEGRPMLVGQEGVEPGPGSSSGGGQSGNDSIPGRGPEAGGTSNVRGPNVRGAPQPAPSQLWNRNHDQPDASSFVFQGWGHPYEDVGEEELEE